MGSIVVGVILYCIIYGIIKHKSNKTEEKRKEEERRKREEGNQDQFNEQYQERLKEKTKKYLTDIIKDKNKIEEKNLSCFFRMSSAGLKSKISKQNKYRKKISTFFEMVDSSNLTNDQKKKLSLKNMLNPKNFNMIDFGVENKSIRNPIKKQHIGWQEEKTIEYKDVEFKEKISNLVLFECDYSGDDESQWKLNSITLKKPESSTVSRTENEDNDDYMDFTADLIVTTNVSIYDLADDKKFKERSGTIDDKRFFFILEIIVDRQITSKLQIKQSILRKYINRKNENTNILKKMTENNLKSLAIFTIDNVLVLDKLLEIENDEDDEKTDENKEEINDPNLNHQLITFPIDNENRKEY